MAKNTMTPAENVVLAPNRVETLIMTIRNKRVMLDSDLADIYQVKTKVLNQSVRRNACRFPEDFMFRLSKDEASRLRSQNVTSNATRGGRRHLPYVFTEHGAVMVASVLNSPVAVQASIHVVRAFVLFREMLDQNKELARRIQELEERYDGQFAVLFEAIRRLMRPVNGSPSERRIGFQR